MQKYWYVKYGIRWEGESCDTIVTADILHNVCCVSGRYFILYFLNILLFAPFRRKADALLFLPHAPHTICSWRYWDCAQKLTVTLCHPRCLVRAVQNYY